MANDQAYLYMPVSRLSSDALIILNRLNARRLLQTNGPVTLPRDYRGLAGLVGISIQDAEHLNVVTVLGTWLQTQPLNAVVHQLFRHLETMDRFDIRDDLRSLAEQGRLVTMNAELVIQQRVVSPENTEMLTEDDMEAGERVLYDAVMLYADVEEDTAFVYALSDVLTEIGFRLFNKDSLRLSVMELSAMAKLISTRCRYTILVISSAFSRNHKATRDEQFYTKYLHAHTVAENTHQMIICVLDDCVVPLELKHYTNLRVQNNGSFWKRLVTTLNYMRKPSLLPVPSWVMSGIHPANSLATNVLTARGLAAVAAPSASAVSGSAHEQFRPLSNPCATNQSSNEPSSSTVVQPPNATVPNASGSVYNVPNWAFINGQVTNESISTSASTVSNSHVIPNGHTGIRIIANDQVANGSIINGQSTNPSTPIVQIADAPVAHVYGSANNIQHMKWSFINSPCSNESPNISQVANSSVAIGQISSGSVANVQEANRLVANSPISNGSVASGQPTCSSVANTAVANAIITNDQVANGSVTKVEVANRSIPNGQITYQPVPKLVIGQPNDQFTNGEDTEDHLNQPSNEYIVNIKVVSERIVANPNAYASDQEGIGQSSQPSNGFSDQRDDVGAIQNSIMENVAQWLRTRTWSVRNMLPQKRARTVLAHTK